MMDQRVEKMKRHVQVHIFLLVIAGLSFFLGAVGLYWGLPSHWHVDERNKVDAVLSMAASRNLNPHTFVNPSLHLYLLFLALLPYFIFAGLIPGFSVDVSVVYMIGRLLSVCLGTATVFAVYAAGKKISGRAAGLLAALALALTMGFVNFMHFATPEITATFLYALAVLWCIDIVETGQSKYYLLAGSCAGLAISTKYTCSVLLVAIIAAAAVRQRGRDRSQAEARTDPAMSVLAGLAVIGASLLLTAPSIVALASFDGLVEPATRGFLAAVRKAGMGAGCALIILALASRLRNPIAQQIVSLSGNKRLHYALACAAAFFLLATPYAALDFRGFLNGLIDDWRYASGARPFSHAGSSWRLYALSLKTIFGTPLFVLCLLGIGYGVWKAFRGSRHMQLLLCAVIPLYAMVAMTPHFAMRFIIPIVPTLCVFIGLIASRMLYAHSRFRALAVVALGLVLVYSLIYTATLDIMFVRDSRSQARAWIAQNIASGSTIDTYSSVEGSLPSFPPGYRLRHVAEVEDPALDDERFSAFLEQYRREMGDFIVLTDISYANYLRHPDVYPGRTRFYRSLLEGSAGYTLVRRFDFQAMIRPEPEAVDPVILILRRGP